MKKLRRFFGTLIWMVPLFMVIMVAMLVASVTIEKGSVIRDTGRKGEGR